MEFRVGLLIDFIFASIDLGVSTAVTIYHADHSLIHFSLELRSQTTTIVVSVICILTRNLSVNELWHVHRIVEC